MEYTKENHIVKKINSKSIKEGNYSIKIFRKSSSNTIKGKLVSEIEDSSKFWMDEEELKYLNENNISLNSIVKLEYIAGLVDPFKEKLPSKWPGDGYELIIIYKNE